MSVPFIIPAPDGESGIPERPCSAVTRAAGTHREAKKFFSATRLTCQSSGQRE